MKKSAATIACVGFLITALAGVHPADGSSVHSAPISMVNAAADISFFLNLGWHF